MVMGTSITSNAETTINTSTESASTLATNVTGTDTSETCDSLDLGNEPNFIQNQKKIKNANWTTKFEKIA